VLIIDWILTLLLIPAHRISTFLQVFSVNFAAPIRIKKLKDFGINIFTGEFSDVSGSSTGVFTFLLLRVLHVGLERPLSRRLLSVVFLFFSILVFIDSFGNSPRNQLLLNIVIYWLLAG
jgi:hypothetical protein